MLVNKNYECKLNLTCEDMKKFNLVSSVDELILNILREKYENKCYIGGFVLDILGIIRRSQLKIMKELDDGTCSVSVLFETRSLIYDRGFIIPDMDVIEPRNNILLAKKDNINARFNMDSDFVGLSSSCKIPVQVSVATYNPGHRNIVIMGEIYKPKINSKVYVINHSKKGGYYYSDMHMIDDTDTIEDINMIDQMMDYYEGSGEDLQQLFEIPEAIQSMMETINEYNDKIKNLDSNIVNYFCSIMYPFKNVKKVDSIKLSEIISHIKEGKELPPMRKSPNINILSGSLEIIKENIDDYEVINVDYNTFMRKMLGKHINNLNFIHSLATSYSTMEEIKSNNAVWRIYNKYIKKIGFKA